MFDHARVHRLLSAYHDGELSAAVAVRIEQHLQACTACRTEYRHLANVGNALRHLPHLEAPPSLARKIRCRIDEEVRGMVPIFRDELLSCRARPVLVPALGLGALLTLSLLAAVLLFGLYQASSSEHFDAALVTTSVAPAFLHVEMVSPRIRDGSVNMLPFTEMERGKAGTLLTFASIDHDGVIRGLHVIDRSGDEQMLARTLEVLRSSGFEPARMGGQKVSVNFLYLFTTTEVRLPVKRSISDYLRSYPTAGTAP